MSISPPNLSLLGIELLPDMSRPHSPAPAPRELQLARVSRRLMEAAGCHIVQAPACAPDPPTCEGALLELQNAMAQFRSHAASAQSPALWTDPSAQGFREIRLALARMAQPREAAHGFLALIAEAVDGPLIYLPRRSPIRVKAPIAGDLRISGPYLVLVLCEAAAPNRIVLTAAHAVAVADRRRLLPVGSDLERDIVKALIHLQAALDGYGVECHIVREPFRHGDAAGQFCITNRYRDKLVSEVRFVVSESGHVKPGLSGSASTGSLVTGKEWRDGTFIAWLIESVRGTRNSASGQT